jgi:hypothetical protein
MAKDDHLDPASEDDAVQAMLDATWRAAMASSRSTMEELRRIYPELSSHLPETGAGFISRALADAEGCYRSLHAAGKHLIGTDDYERYLQAQTRRALGG